MDWTHWQTYAALAVVLLTLGIFIIRGLKRWFLGSAKDCCGGRCGCATPMKRNKLQDR